MSQELAVPSSMTGQGGGQISLEPNVSPTVANALGELDTAPPLRAALNSGFDLNAERAARMRRMSEMLGVSENVVREAPQEAETEAAARSIEQNAMFAEWAAQDERNAALAKEDLQGFSDFFSYLGRRWDANTEAAGAAWDSGVDTFTTAELGRRIAAGDDSARPQLEEVYQRQAERQAAMKNGSLIDDLGLTSALQQAPQFLSIQLPSATEGMGMALAVEGAFIGTGAAVGGAGGATIGSVVPGPGTVAGGVIGGAGGATAGTFAGLGPALTAGKATYALRTGQRMYDMERGVFAAEMSRMRDVDGKPVDRKTIEIASTIYGVAAGVLEGGGELLFFSLLKGAGAGGEAAAERLGAVGVKQGLKTALARLAASPVGRSRLAKIAAAVTSGGLAEGGTEGLQELAAVVVDYGALSAEESDGEKYFPDKGFTPENLERITDAAAEGFKAGIWLRGAPAGISHAFGSSHETAAVDFAERQGELFGKVDALKVKALSPEITQEILENNGVTDKVFLPAVETLNLAQSDEALYSALGVSEVAVQEAAAAGQDLEVGNAALLSRLTPEQFERVRPLMRQSPDSINVAEVEAREARVQEDVNRVLEMHRDAETQEVALGQMFDGLREQIARAVENSPGLKAQVEAGGGMATYADAHMKQIRAFVDRVGTDAESRMHMLARLTVQGEKAPAATQAATLHQDGSTPRTAAVVDVDPSVIPVDLKDTAALRDWVREKFQGKTLTIRDDGSIVGLADGGLRASVKKRGEKQRPTYAGLDSLLESALHDGFEEADARHPELEGQRVYQSAMRIGDTLYAVRFKVDMPKREPGKGYYKDHKTTKIEMAPAPYVGPAEQSAASPLVGTEPGGSVTGAIREISIDILKGEVKPSGIRDGILYQPVISKSPRGSFTIAEDGYTITLSKHANLSTLAHESAHWFREELRRAVESGLADERLAADVAMMDDKLARFNDDATLKAEYDQHLRGRFKKAFSNLSESEKTQAREIAKHEYFARSFEAYLREGKPPAREFYGIFGRFKRWLTAIYKDSRRLGVELDDDVRGFFDRLLAAEARIEETAAANELMAMTRKELDALGVSGPDRDFAAGLMRAAKERAVEKLQQRMNRERSTRRAAWAEEARAGIMADPVYMARAAMRGEGALDPVLTAELYGEDAVKTLRKNAGPGVFRKDGADPELFAAEHGFASGAEMMAKVSEAEPIGKAVKRYVDAKEAEHDATIDPTPLLLETEEAAKQAEMVGQYLARHLGKDHLHQEAFRRVAEKKLEALPMKEARSSAMYLAAMRRALRRERAAISRGDFAAALEANSQGRLNMELARLANEVSEMQERTQREAGRFEKQKSADPNARYIVMDIAMRYRLGTFNERLAAGRDQSTIRGWITAKEEDGFPVYVDDAVLYGPGKDWREATVAEFRNVAETVAQIRAVERNSRKLLTAQNKADFAAAVKAAVDTIFTFRKPKPTKTAEEPGFVRHGLSVVHAAHTKIESLCLALDGDKPLGENWNLVYRPINEAENRRGVMYKALSERMKGAELFGAYSDKELTDMARKKEYIREINESLTKGQRIVAALNMGNEGNYKRLLDGHGWTEAQAAAVVSTLNTRDWNFVQAVWDTFEGYKEESFKLQEDVSGVRPQSVEARPLQTPAGMLRGGYFPVVYDSRHAKVDLQEKLITNDNPAFSMTKHGHLKDRTTGGAGTPLDLSLSVIPARLNDVITDLCFRKAYIDVGRVLRSSEYRRAIESTVGHEQYQAMVAWLKDAAKESNPRTDGENMARWARASATMMAMGYKFTTILSQPFGITQSIELIGKTNVLKGLNMAYGKGVRGTLETITWVKSVSSMMETRIQSFDRDVADTTADFSRQSLAPDSLVGALTNKVGLRRFEKWLKKNAFVPMGVVQFGVDLPTWLGAYQKGLKDFTGSESKAIEYADSIVRLSQGSGQAKDLARIQRGNQYAKLFTMFYSYFNTLYNMTARRVADVNMHRDAGSVMRAANSFLLLYVIPAVLTEITAGRGPDEEEDFWPWAFKQVAMYPFQTVVGVRSFASAIEAEFGFKASPAEDAPATVYNWLMTVNKALTDEDYKFDGKKFARLSLRTVGFLSGMPLGQAEISAFNVVDYLDGTDGDFELRDLLFRRQKSRR